MRFTRAAVLAVVVVATTAVPAVAGGGTDLPLPAFGDIAVDQVHQRVFVSGGPTANGIVVTDLRGKVVKRLDGQPGATGLELNADSTRLYVALAAGDAISVIDTTTLAETDRHATGTSSCPTHLARTGALIWFGYGCAADWNAKIGRLDPAATPPVDTSKPYGGATYQRAPLLSSTGAENGPLAAGQLSLSQSTIRTYTRSGSDLTAAATSDTVGAGLVDLSTTPDGSTLYSATTSRTTVDAYAPTTLARRGAFTTGTRPIAVAASPDNAFVATAVATNAPDDVKVYRAGGTSPVATFEIPRTEVAATRGLAWTPDLSRLYVITQTITDPAPHLRVITDPTDDPCVLLCD
ncbi:hypothetical protein JOD54_004969 [Actinokineospora baliensis]|uniref:YncE family protein n=1 Tax=Actinokineospora baliensis TaxID=547056 RepID=UPI001957441F|nr:hypothetical protein [Actinokineospora baliensis]MBM7774765.1 hypothetical protein [Actinokineospora baliensis]